MCLVTAAGIKAWLYEPFVPFAEGETEIQECTLPCGCRFEMIFLLQGISGVCIRFERTGKCKSQSGFRQQALLL